MKRNFRLAFTVLFLLLFITQNFAQKKGFISVRGRVVIYPDGSPFLMRGTNLGNWLVPEGYMFGFKSTNSPRLIDAAISELVGPDEAIRCGSRFIINCSPANITWEEMTLSGDSGCLIR